MLKEADVVIIRFGEISLKSSNVRSRMINRLCENINAALKNRGIEGTVYNKWSRVIVTDFDDPEKIVETVSSLPGVVSVSPCKVVEPDIDSMVEGLLEISTDNFEGNTFGIKARRAGDKNTHEFSSRDICEKAGSSLLENLEEAEVDLEDPDQWFYVECRKEKAFLYLEKYRGPGGLPVGSEGKVVSLISGGHDSPVATYKMMCRGCEVIPLYFSMGEYSGIDIDIRAFKTVEQLKKFAPNFDWDVRVADIGKTVEDLMEDLKNTRMVVLRRFMLIVAEKLAEKEGARGIVTGESLGQKSSQTLGNLDVVSKVVDMPVHRPLISFDKSEIIGIAREIGTFEGSSIESGCVNLAPNRPEVSGDFEKIVDVEPGYLEERAEQAVRNISIEEV